MKTLMIALSLLLTDVYLQEVERTMATFDGFDDGTFFFIDEDGYNLEFDQIEEKLLKKFSLTTDRHKGKRFEISYTTETDFDDEDEEISVSKIVDLKMMD